MDERLGPCRGEVDNPPQAVEEAVGLVHPRWGSDAGMDAQVLGDGGEQGIESVVTSGPRLCGDEQAKRLAVVCCAAEELEDEPKSDRLVYGFGNRSGEVSDAEDSRVGVGLEAQAMTGGADHPVKDGESRLAGRRLIGRDRRLARAREVGELDLCQPCLSPAPMEQLPC